MATVNRAASSRAKRPSPPQARVPVAIVALDVASTRDAVRLVEQLGSACAFYKVGSELFTAAGPAIVDYLRARGSDVFLDLKLHDIPNTVERASAVAAESGVRLLTVHAVGGRDMIRAAVAGATTGAARAGTSCGILAVTVLTSLDALRLGESWGRKIGGVEREVLRLAEQARQGRAAGVVCSGDELAGLRRKFGERMKLLVPGIRPGRVPRSDQVRVITPAAAAKAGADYVVLGRAVTHADDPAAAYAAIVAELHSGGVTAG